MDRSGQPGCGAAARPGAARGGRSAGDGHTGAAECLRELLAEAVRRGASDVHLVPDLPPVLRVHGRLERCGAALSRAQVEAMCRWLLPAALRGAMDRRRNFDVSVCPQERGLPARFRASIYRALGAWCACLRHIPGQIPSLEWLGFPAALAERIVSLPHGLVVVTGVAGSGKSATLAALIDLLRRTDQRRILTIEEPVEYVHPPDAGGLITQREVGRDVASFADGLKYGLRQDPDVILVGEIRDRQTAQMALTAAETGHLILTTMHTRDAKGAVTRLVDLFPQEVQEEVRRQVAMSLRVVVCQRLLPPAEAGARRVLALEVLVVTPAAQAAIRTGKVETLDSVIQTGRREGMVALDDELARLLATRRITLETARRLARDPDALRPPAESW